MKGEYERVVKIIGNAIFWVGSVASIILFFVGIFEGDSILDPEPINLILTFSGLSLFLFVTLPTWGILTMLANISNSLKNPNKKENEE